MLNKVLLIGRLTKDPIIRHTSNGGQIVELTIAYNRRYSVGEEWKEESHFFDVKAFGKLAQALGERLSKGYLVVVEGRLVQDKWTDRNGNSHSKVRIVAENVRIISKPREEDTREDTLLDSYDNLTEDFPDRLFNSENDEIGF